MPEKVKEWSSQIIWVIGIIFICGMTYQSIGSMDTRVTTNTSDIKINRQSLHNNEIVQAKIYTRLEGIPEIKAEQKELNDKLDELVKHLLKFDYQLKGDE